MGYLNPERTLESMNQPQFGERFGPDAINLDRRFDLWEELQREIKDPESDDSSLFSDEEKLTIYDEFFDTAYRLDTGGDSRRGKGNRRSSHNPDKLAPEKSGRKGYRRGGRDYDLREALDEALSEEF